MFPAVVMASVTSTCSLPEVSSYEVTDFTIIFEIHKRPDFLN